MTHDSAPLDELHHVAIEVASVADAVQWYQANFRCETEYHDATWALLRFGNTRLALVMPGDHPPHLGFATDNAARFGDLREHRDGSRSVYRSDPFGNVVEFIERSSLGNADRGRT